MHTEGMKKMKLINKKTITIYTIAIFILSVLVFEIGYCNCLNIERWISNKEFAYNFSVCRIVMYILCAIMCFLVRKKILQEAIDMAKHKYKRVLIYTTIITTLLIFILTILVVIIANIKPILFRAISIGLLTIFAGNIFMIYVSNNIIKNTILLSATFGAIFSITTTYNHFLDEKKHFMTAFNIAYGNFDYSNNPVTDKKIEQLPQVAKFSIIDDFLQGNFKAELTHEVNKEDIPSTPANYNPLLYMAPALGIFIAKTLGGSIIDLYIMGRLFNLALYTVLICLALKLLPYKRNIFSVVFFMPMAVILAASYSIDGICIGCVSLFIAYCLKLKAEKETIGIRDFIYLIAMFIVLLLAKSMAYIMVAFISLMLPVIPTLKKNKKYLPIIITLTIMSCILLVALAIHVKNTKISSDTRGGSNIDVARQLDNLTHNPVADIQLIIEHMKTSLLNIDWYISIYTPVFFTQYASFLVIPMMLFVLYISITEDDYIFTIKDKIILISSYVFVFLMTSLILYLSFTEVAANNIKGYQSRYIIPILPLVLMCFSNTRFTYNKSNNRNLNIAIINAMFLGTSIMLNILS